MSKLQAIVLGVFLISVFVIAPLIFLWKIDKQRWNKNNEMTRNVYCDNFLRSQGIDPIPDRWDDTLWYNKNGIDYCNDLAVNMTCIISNQGSACHVEKRGEKNG